MSSSKQLPARHVIEGIAGNPLTFTVTTTGATITSPAVTIKDGSRATITADPSVPTVSQVGSVTTVAFAVADTSALGGSAPKNYTYSLQAMVDGDGPFELVADRLTILPVGSAGTSSTSAAALTVTVGAAALSLTVSLGGSIQAHLDDTTDAHDASAISFSPAGTVAATDVQTAIAEVATEAASALAAHTGDSADAHDASSISVLDTAERYAATDVESALAELRGSVVSPALVTGGTDNSSAFEDAYETAAGSRVALGLFTTMTGSKVIDIPAGVFKVTDSEAFMRDLGIARTRGLAFRGAGKYITVIDFQPSTADARLLYNNDDWLHVSFEGITFNCSGANAATATFFDSVSTGGAQNYKFTECVWSGTWKYGLALSGSNNNSEMTWTNCGIYGVIDSFLHADADGSDQFVNYNFIATDFEVGTGSLVTLYKGGSVNIFGGSLMMIDQPASDTYLINLLGDSHDGGTMRCAVIGVRVELLYEECRFLQSNWAGGVLHFASIDTTSQASQSGADAWVQVSVDLVNGEGPAITWHDCSLMGKHEYKTAVAGYQRRHLIKYDGCELLNHTSAHDFIVSSTGANSGSIPQISFENCRGSRSTSSSTIAFDCVVNWEDAYRGAPRQRNVVVKGASGGLPTTAQPVVLPLNAIVTKMWATKPAQGSSSDTAWAYTLTDADANSIAALAASGTAWLNAWTRSSSDLYHVCNTANRRTLTLTPSGSVQTAADGHLVIEYIA